MKLPKPKALLLDLDDTLLDTTLSATRVWRATAEAFAEEIGSPTDVFNPVLDASRKWYWSDPQRNREGRIDLHRSRVAVTRHGLEALGLPDKTPEQLADLAERFTGYYTEHRVGSMRFFEGALEALEALKADGVPMALITNGNAAGQRAKVERFDLERFFEVVWIEGERGVGKPEERAFAGCLRACGVEAEDAWCVGDHLDWEVAAPQALGLRGVWVDWAGTGLPVGTDVSPDAVVRGVRELRGLMAG